MGIEIKSITTKKLDIFHKAAKKLLLNQYLDYPMWVRLYYWKRDFNKNDLTVNVKNGDTILFVATLKGQIIGFIKIEIRGAGSVEVDWLIIDKKHRKKGLGTKLLNLADDMARKHHCHFLYLYTENINNIDYYKKRGYYLVGLHKKAWQGQDEYLMQKDISKPDIEYLKTQAKEKHSN